MWQGGPEAQIQRPLELFLHVIHRMCGRRLLLWCSINQFPVYLHFNWCHKGAMVRSRHTPRTCHHSITGHTRTIDSHIHLSIPKMKGGFFIAGGNWGCDCDHHRTTMTDCTSGECWLHLKSRVPSKYDLPPLFSSWFVFCCFCARL